jgi:hypothetical protein
LSLEHFQAVDLSFYLTLTPFKFHAVKPRQTIARRCPNIAIFCLQNRIDGFVRQALFGCPAIKMKLRVEASAEYQIDE